MNIGTIKEVKIEEHRVGLTPGEVKELVKAVAKALGMEWAKF